MVRRTSRLFVRALEDRITPSFSEFLDPHPAPGNQFGATVLPLSTGNVCITSPFDDYGGTDAGAVYLFNGKTGALISTLRGSHPGDMIGSGGRDGNPGYEYYYHDGVKPLPNGNYLVLSPFWHNGDAEDAGAVTFCNGNTGVSGAVSAGNSLVGTHPDDYVGFKYYLSWQFGPEIYTAVTVLANGDYVVRSPQWDNGLAVDA